MGELRPNCGGGIGHKRRTAAEAPRAERERARRDRQAERIRLDRALKNGGKT